jgi:hypothetical protein
LFSEYTLSTSQSATQGTIGYFGKLIKKIVKNIRADVKNVKVAIVHRTKDNRVLKAGIELASLNVSTPLDQDIENLMSYTKYV